MTAAFNLSQFANKVNTSGQADLTTAVTGTLPIANGGTGLTSAGAAGNVLQSNGSAWTSATIAIFAGNSGQAFTSSGTFTIPSGITKLKVTVLAGGGNGGSSSGVSPYQQVGGGGGAGGSAIKFFTGLTPGATLAVTVGAAGGASSVASGTQTITTVSATAGSAGASNGGYSAAGGAGGIGSGGDANIKGTPGFPSLCHLYNCGQYMHSVGAGGSSILGGGGNGIASGNTGGVSANGTAAGAYGSGGGGSIRQNNASGTSTAGAGSAGIVIFEW